jgi:hypothetical protein
MSLTVQLKRHLPKLKTHKSIREMSPTERRLNFMTAIILNKNLTKEEKDKRLKRLVAESQVEKLLKQRGIKVSV